MLTLSKQTTPAGRRYVIRTMAFMGGYVAVMLTTIGGPSTRSRTRLPPGLWP
ncbi:hypothetical protein ABE444_08890 [Brevundimonas pondensis]|uniref:hypothetical protein n=1 Tax=Brevundimonas pondensis TaxID=2774189 RepID=UPI0032099B48